MHINVEQVASTHQKIRIGHIGQMEIKTSL